MQPLVAGDTVRGENVTSCTLTRPGYEYCLLCGTHVVLIRTSHPEHTSELRLSLSQFRRLINILRAFQTSLWTHDPDMPYIKECRSTRGGATSYYQRPEVC
jgi:hypothetical protein